MPRKKTKQRYTVKITREIRHVAEVEVEATSSEEAKQLAREEADAPRSGYWREDAVVDEHVSVTGWNN